MEDLQHELTKFIGKENYYCHAIGNFDDTQGVQYFTDKTQCYWLLEYIAVTI